jgi:sporulation protein YlmC with PRC-barrel domain
MRLDPGSAVHCTDGLYGELGDVVIDPIKRRVTHLVVQPHHRHDLARLVPVDRAHARAPSTADIILDYTVGEIDQLEPLQRSAYLRLGEVPVEDPDWEVGIESFFALPYYGSLSAGEFGMSVPAVGYDEHVAEVYDRVPKDTVEIRRASAVISSDDHHLGHVDGFVVDSGEQITHLVLEHGHLWGKREITIPIAACASIANDQVKLSLSKDQVGDLRPVPLHRWAS